MWFALLLSALAAAGKAAQDHEVARRQDKVLARSMAEQADSEREARAKIGENLRNFSTENADQAKQQETGDYLEQVQQAMGGGSPYKADSSLAQSVQLQNKRSADNKASTRTLADLFGTIGGAGVQRQNENIGTARTGSEIQRIGQAANRLAAARRNQAMGIRANPWVSMMLNAAQAYGRAGAGGLFSGGGNMASAAGLGGSGFGIEGAGNAARYAGYA